MQVIGIGDNVVDRYEHTRIRYPGGNALNFSVYAAMLQTHAAYLGIFGDDSAARHVERALQARQIDISRCRRYPGENGYASLTHRQGERIFLGSNQGGVRRHIPLDFIMDEPGYLAGFDLMHTSLYSYADHLLERLSQLPGRLSYDFSDDFDPASALELCRYLHFAFFSCAERSPADTRQLLREAHASGCRYVIATRGAQGALLYDGAQWHEQLPVPVTPVDTLGAGDAFITAFLLAFMQQREHPAAITSSLSQAASFAARICLCEGAFGEGEAF